ncbi:MAG: serine hydrolase [Synergistaceae bacterium]|nr:serine hydrolase [Synergistota bacterium]NLM70671.1 serine hydrolase [Synergistaceae bacterium]
MTIEIAWIEIIKKHAEEFSGTAGLVVHSLADGEKLVHNGDRVFSSASLIKLGILNTLFLKAARGELSLDEKIKLGEGMAVDGGLLHKVRPGTPWRLDDLALLMIVLSDNTATNMLIDRLGIEEINRDFKRLGLENTVLGRKMLDFEAKKAGRDNFTTAADTARILEVLHSGEELPPGYRARAMDILSAQKLNNKLPGLIPVDDPDDLEQFLAHKTGELPGIEHDAGIFFFKSKTPVVAVVLTEGHDRQEAVQLCAWAGKTIYEAFREVER